MRSPAWSAQPTVRIDRSVFTDEALAPEIHRRDCGCRGAVRLAAGCGSTTSDSTSSTVAAADCTPDKMQTQTAGRAHGGDRQAGLPAVLRGRRPDQRQGLRERHRLRDRRPARLSPDPTSSGRSSRSTPPTRPGPKDFDFDVNQISITPARAQAGRLLGAVLHGQPGGRRARRAPSAAGATSLADLKDAKIGVQIGTTSLDAVERRDRALERAEGLQRLQRRRHRAEEGPGRRGRRRPADRALPDRGAGARARRSSASSRPPAATNGAPCSPRARRSPRCVSQRDRRTARLRRARQDHEPLDEPGRRGARAALTPWPPLALRASRAVTAIDSDGRRPPRANARRPSAGARRRGQAIAAVSSRDRASAGWSRWSLTSPGWPNVRDTFFSWSAFKDSFPDVLEGLLARRQDVRGHRGRGADRRPGRSPWSGPAAPPPCSRCGCWPTVFVDVFRGVPTILLVYLVGFGIPALELDRAAHRSGRARRDRAHPLLQRLRGRGLPGRDPLGPPRPARRRARDRAHRGPGAAPRDPAAGGAPRRRRRS